jgi:hypothetical protein
MRRITSAALVTAALAALLASPSLHHPAGEPLAAPAISAHAFAPELCSDREHSAPHDHELCPICRATAQARLALRVPTRLAAPLLEGAGRLPLHVSAAAAPAAAPVLSGCAPRAPPGVLSALEA